MWTLAITEEQMSGSVPGHGRLRACVAMPAPFRLSCCGLGPPAKTLDLSFLIPATVNAAAMNEGSFLRSLPPGRRAHPAPGPRAHPLGKHRDSWLPLQSAESWLPSSPILGLTGLRDGGRFSCFRWKSGRRAPDSFLDIYFWPDQRSCRQPVLTS